MLHGSDPAHRRRRASGHGYAALIGRQSTARLSRGQRRLGADHLLPANCSAASSLPCSLLYCLRHHGVCQPRLWQRAGLGGRGRDWQGALGGGEEGHGGGSLCACCMQVPNHLLLRSPCQSKVHPTLLAPCCLQSFSSLSSQTDKVAQIVAQVIGGTMGKRHEFGDILVSTRFGEGAWAWRRLGSGIRAHGVQMLPSACVPRNVDCPTAQVSDLPAPHPCRGQGIMHRRPGRHRCGLLLLGLLCSRSDSVRSQPPAVPCCISPGPIQPPPATPACRCGAGGQDPPEPL